MTQDDKLRKREVKVTLIATGFGKEIQPTLFRREENFKNPEQSSVVEKNGKNKKNNTVEENLEDDGKEWEVPAFIRRKK